MDYKARFYDAALGRFIQPDTIIPSMADPQSWNRYSYVLNDPTGLTDPSGNFGKRRDDKSDYRNKIMEKRVHALEAKWEKEKLADLLKRAQAMLRIERMETLLSAFATPSASVLSVNPAQSPVSTPLAAPDTYVSGEQPNPSVWKLVAVGIPLTIAIGFVEAGLGLGEIALAKITLAAPISAIITLPLEAVLVTASLAAGDLEVSYLAYTYRVMANPSKHQDFILTPPWGLY